jgi:uncharacterized repeat protein (TIGR03803 family)
MRRRLFNSISVLALCLTVLLLTLSTAVRAQDVEPTILLHGFTKSATDGITPYGNLLQGKNGDLYGTTFGAGAHGGGTVFKIKTDGSGFTLLHSFNSSDGANPAASLIQWQDGCLYGTTENGGAYTNFGRGNDGSGTVFKIKTDGSGFTLLHSFNISDGAFPTASLIQGSDGYLYGTTDLGGAFTHVYDGGFGTVFKIKADGSGSILHSFNGSDGHTANGLVRGKDGVLYGTTLAGGKQDQGTVFKLNPDGSSFTDLYSFNGPDGADPQAGLILGKDGYLYGTTSGGGATGNGAVFKLKADGSYFTLLHSFGGSSSDGTYPNGLIQGEDGNLYGTNFGDGITRGGDIYGGGTIFRIGPVAASLDPKILDVNVNTLLTVTGSGFASNDVICWNGTRLATTFLSSTELQVTVPVYLLSKTGTAQITVWDPNISNTSNSLVAHIRVP